MLLGLQVISKATPGIWACGGPCGAVPSAGAAHLGVLLAMHLDDLRLVAAPAAQGWRRGVAARRHRARRPPRPEAVGVTQ